MDECNEWMVYIWTNRNIASEPTLAMCCFSGRIGPNYDAEIIIKLQQVVLLMKLSVSCGLLALRLL